MHSFNKIFRGIALILLITSGILSTTQDELNIFKEFQQQQAVMADKGNVKIDKKMNPDMEQYKTDIFELIVNKGTNQAQINAVKSMGALAAKQGDSKFGKKVLAMVQTRLAKAKRLVPQTDDPYYFLNTQSYVRSIYQIPLSGQGPGRPWSSTYWAMKSGGISVRYAMNASNTIGMVSSSGGYIYYYTWMQSITKYYQPREHQLYSRSANYASYVYYNYSPAEKYDLLMGDLNFTLTNYIKREGYRYASNGNIPGWYGICHGWAPAAYVFQRPVRPVTITSADGIQIVFLPDDLKALASQFMANADYTTRWIGARCNYFSGNSGWYSDPACRSLNPGAFLIAMGNWMGLKGKNFVFDPQADPEIWNQPVVSYVVRYYNVITQDFYSTAASSRVTVNQVRSCGTPWCRTIASSLSSSAAYIVGVFFKVTYTVETDPVHSSSSRPDSFKTAYFDGAVELDVNGNIIGGTWRYTNYPNFMWMPDRTMSITSISDVNITSFAGSAPELKALTTYAQAASARGQLIRAVIDLLVQRGI